MHPINVNANLGAKFTSNSSEHVSNTGTMMLMAINNELLKYLSPFMPCPTLQIKVPLDLSFTSFTTVYILLKMTGF